MFLPDAGSFAGQRFLIIDGDGVDGYTAGADFVFLLQGAMQIGFFSPDDFG
jgi:hypothetical protein